jgi:hypothetical protein
LEKAAAAQHEHHHGVLAGKSERNHPSCLGRAAAGTRLPRRGLACSSPSAPRWRGTSTGAGARCFLHAHCSSGDGVGDGFSRVRAEGHGLGSLARIREAARCLALDGPLLPRSCWRRRAASLIRFHPYQSFHVGKTVIVHRPSLAEGKR